MSIPQGSTAFPMCRADCRDFQCRRLGRCKIAPTMPQLPDVALAEGFGDVPTLFASRDWLQKALEAKGAKITGGGFGCGQCDLDFVLEGCTFYVSLRPRVSGNG